MVPITPSAVVAEVTGASVENMGLIHRGDSDITSLADLAGKRVSVGAPGSGTEVNAKALLEANGMSFDDFEVRGLNFNESADALRDGDIDAGFWSVGPSTSSIVSLANTRDIALVSLSESELANAQDAVPVFAPYQLRAGAYEGVDAATAVGVASHGSQRAGRGSLAAARVGFQPDHAGRDQPARGREVVPGLESLSPGVPGHRLLSDRGGATDVG